jgi:hypothetical protein
MFALLINMVGCPLKQAGRYCLTGLEDIVQFADCLQQVLLLLLPAAVVAIADIVAVMLLLLLAVNLTAIYAEDYLRR